MSKTASSTELRKMSASDLRKELAEKRLEVAKMRMSVNQRSEKDTAKYRREKKHIARLLTVISQVEDGAGKTLKAAPKASKVPAHRSSKSEGGSASKKATKGASTSTSKTA